MSTSDSSLLHSLLVALEAPGNPAFLEHELEQAQAAGVLCDADAAAARRIQQSLIRGRRRENLLRVLLESSTDLAAITDVEEVLHAIVRRTRTLLGSDMAYISLNDYEHHETYIQTTDGVATESYRNIRMELGTGILGKIAGGTSPSQSLDYTSDPDVIHVPEIDRTVEGEGVHSIMGAPLLRNGVLLGALLVAERYQRQFTAEEMWLVESMSSLAGVALSNARLIGEMKATLRERDVLLAERELERLGLSAEQSLERAMMECVVGHDPYGSFLALLGARAGVDAWIIDSAGQTLHGPGSPGLRKRDLAEAMSQSIQTTEVYCFSTSTERGGAEATFSLMTAGAGSRTLGAVLLAGKVDGAMRRNLNHSGLMLSVMLLIDESHFASDVRTQSELIGLLIRQGTEHESNISSRVARFGVHLGRPATVHVIDADGQEERVLSLMRTHTDAAQGVMAITNGSVVFIHPSDIAQESLELLTSQGLRATIGTDTIEAFAGSLHEAYISAHRSLRALLVLGMAGSAGSRQSLGMVGLLLHTASQEAVDDVITRAIGPLLDYDTAKQTQLVETVWVFFTTGRRHSAAAAALHVHPNTLRQRLDRVGLILGQNWTDPTPSSQLYLLLQLHRLRSLNV